MMMNNQKLKVSLCLVTSLIMLGFVNSVSTYPYFGVTYNSYTPYTASDVDYHTLTVFWKMDTLDFTPGSTAYDFGSESNYNYYKIYSTTPNYAFSDPNSTLAPRYSKFILDITGHNGSKSYVAWGFSSPTCTASNATACPNCVVLSFKIKFFDCDCGNGCNTDGVTALYQQKGASSAIMYKSSSTTFTNTMTNITIGADANAITDGIQLLLGLPANNFAVSGHDLTAFPNACALSNSNVS